MRAPDFWWRDEPSLAARLLSPIGAIYGAVAARRMARSGARAALPVICIGNLVAGGAGKTPTALAVARLLAEAGGRPAFLTRGYGGRLHGPVAVDLAAHGVADVGDEPLLLARTALTVVARNRPAGATLAAQLGASVIVMDDGLQNPSLMKNLALAVIDAQRGVGNGLCLPAGPLRAPVDGQLTHVDALVLIGEGAAGARVADVAARRGIPRWAARLAPEPEAAWALNGRQVVAFAGIGRPEKFFATLAETGAVIVERMAFVDHHRFTDNDVAAIARHVGRGLVPVTTEKDAARLNPAQRSALGGLVVLPASLHFDDEAAVRKLLADSLNHGSSSARRSTT